MSTYSFCIPLAEKKIGLTVFRKSQAEYIKKNYYFISDHLHNVKYSVNFAQAQNNKLLIRMFPKKIDIFCPIRFRMKYLDLIFKIAAQLLFFKQVLILHGSSLVINKQGYVFSGRSGTGKSTIVRGQKNVLSDETCIIKIKGRKFYVYPSPFDKGKVKVQYKKEYRLRAIFFIKQAKTDTVVPIQNEKAFNLILENSYINQLYQVQINKNSGKKPLMKKKAISLKTKNIFLHLWWLVQSVKIAEQRFTLSLGFLKILDSQYG